MKAALENEVARFRSLYPTSTVRFAEIIGRRVSHLAGPVDRLPLKERRVPVNDRVLMFIGNRDEIGDADLERFSLQVAALLGGDDGV